MGDSPRGLARAQALPKELSEDAEEEGGECRGGSGREDTGEEVVVCEDIGEWEGTQERGRVGVREIEREDEVVCEEEDWENSEASVSGGESEGASEVVREGVREIVRGGVREEGVVVCEEECVACELAVKQMRGGKSSTWHRFTGFWASKKKDPDSSTSQISTGNERMTKEEKNKVEHGVGRRGKGCLWLLRRGKGKKQGRGRGLPEESPEVAESPEEQDSSTQFESGRSRQEYADPNSSGPTGAPGLGRIGAGGLGHGVVVGGLKRVGERESLETPPEEGGDSQGRDLQQVVGGERAAEEVGEGLGEGSGVGERLEEGLQGNLISNSDVLMQMYPELPGRCKAVASPGCPAGEEGKGGDRGGGGGVGADAAGASGAADADVAASSGAGDADMAARDPAGHASSAPRGGTAEPLPSRPPRLLAVLSVDGGGVRDAIPTQICVRLEAMLQERCGDPHVRLADFFDLFAGTGRGGLLALMLTAPHRAAGWGTSSGGLLALMLAAPHRATGQPAIRAQDTDNRAPVVGVCLRSCSQPLTGQRAGRPSGLRTKERSGGGLLALMLTAPHRATGRPAIRAQSTSGGGLLALMLTAPHRATGRPAIRAQDVEVLEQLLRHFLRQHCGAADLCLSEAVKPLLLTSYDISTARPYFFLSLRALSDSSHDFPLIQASCEGELGGEL
ncbi:unnamed protein product [Closterium sp. NIES-64]|nr:unnamed protein product [Closterium sp. NIES-64]